MLLIAFYLLLSVLAAACSAEGTVKDNCEADHCEMVGTTEVCTQCKTAGNVPINGVCTLHSEGAVTSAGCKKKDGNTNVGVDDKTCGQCDGAYFLYKGGCYSTSDATGQKLCTAAAGGVCTKAAAGYFIPPDAQKTDQSVIVCSDVTEVTLTNNKKYKGVQHCTVCTAPGAAADSTAKPAVCTECSEGFFVASSGSECKACGDENCAKCEREGKKQCNECKATDTKVYLKIEADSKTGECIEKASCNGDYFPNDNVDGKKQCIACGSGTHGGVANCKTCTLKGKPEGSILITCSVCTAGTSKPSTDGTKCVQCSVDGCDNCNEDNVCAKCTNDKKLTPTKECIDKCEKLEGYFNGNDGTCKMCNSVCKTCSGEDLHQCTSCPARKVLKYTTEGTPENGSTCVDECKTDTNGCAECGATIGEARYCSKCSDAKQAPLNGNCTVSARAAASCKKVEGGVCKECEAKYFLFEGGCYETARQPGMQICDSIANGKCQTCANTLKADTSTGACPSCPTGCATCTAAAAGQTYTCQTCFTGYYLDSTKNLCIKCTESSGDIQGVTNCASCAVPTSNSGPVTCYAKKDGTGGGDNSDGDNSGSGGGSTNKSGLSTGAIAGIAVAAIVVVGGLVGFLCWWFICRGKA
ncbi:VSP [Giardia lamblia P15]|uniref:VSP n=1 Tax=Giardia intestinalis (strain P15) TaxID=658858 RepID=E1F0T4_GIAIA|nr:VSP [Giardia lamblia P15]